MDAHTRLSAARTWLRAALVLPLLSGWAMAQSNVTVSSGDGTRFTLYVNGAAQPGMDHRYELTNLSGTSVTLKAEVTVPEPGEATATFSLAQGRSYQVELMRNRNAYRLQITGESGAGATPVAPAPPDAPVATEKRGDMASGGFATGGRGRGNTSGSGSPTWSDPQPTPQPPTSTGSTSGRQVPSGRARGGQSDADYNGEYAPQGNTNWDDMNGTATMEDAPRNDNSSNNRTYGQSGRTSGRTRGNDGRGWDDGGRGNNGWGPGGNSNRGGGWDDGGRGNGNRGGGWDDDWDRDDRRDWREPRVTGWRGRPLPMHPADYEALRRRLARAAFTDERRMILDFALRRNFFTTRQVAGLMGAFPFDRDRLALARRAFPNVVDKGRYDWLAESFTFNSTRREFYNWLNRIGW